MNLFSLLLKFSKQSICKWVKSRLCFSVNERTNPGCQNPVTLDECMAIFRILQNDFYTEYKMYELESLAVALVFPIVRTV